MVLAYCIFLYVICFVLTGWYALLERNPDRQVIYLLFMFSLFSPILLPAAIVIGVFYWFAFHLLG